MSQHIRIFTGLNLVLQTAYNKGVFVLLYKMVQVIWVTCQVIKTVFMIPDFYELWQGVMKPWMSVVPTLRIIDLQTRINVVEVFD